MSFCGQCGHPVAADDRFCGSCGEPTLFAGVGGSPETDPTVPVDLVATATDELPGETVRSPFDAATPLGNPRPLIGSSTIDELVLGTDEPDRADGADGADDSQEWLRPARRSLSPVMIIGFLALMALAAGLTVLLLADDAPGGAPVPTTVAAATSAPITTTPALSTTPSTVPASTVLTTTTVVLSAGEQLAAWQAADRTTVETFVGRWVPQLSGKRPGTIDDGITYDEVAIVALHQTLRAEHGALLLYSGEYTYQSDDLWVSIAPTSFATANGALQWCVSESIGRDDCFAKLITHDPSISDTVQMQP